MSESSALEKLLAALKFEQKETKPHSCGCRKKCLVVLEYSGTFLKTTSLHVAAGVSLAKRLYSGMNQPEFYLWAQECQPELWDKVEAIYNFSACPRILEYADTFEDWKEAVQIVRRRVVQAAEEKKKYIVVSIDNSIGQAFDPQADVKKLYEMPGYFIEQMYFTYQGKELVPGKTFADYGILNESTVEKVYRR